METIPIKKPWKKPERIFFRQFKKGEPFYYKHEWYNASDELCSAYERELAYSDTWHPVVYLGTDEFDCPVYYMVMGARGYLTKQKAEKGLNEYAELRKAIGAENVPPYDINNEFKQAIKAKFAA